MTVQSYLFFNGRCEEALSFYREALGAKVNAMMRFSESPDKPPPECGPVRDDAIMHASFTVGDTEVMASDGMASGGPDFRGFSLALSVADEAEARKRFEALSRDGQVQMPLGRTFFSPCFGMAVDRFGVSWMVLVVA